MQNLVHLQLPFCGAESSWEYAQQKGEQWIGVRRCGHS